MWSTIPPTPATTTPVITALPTAILIATASAVTGTTGPHSACRLRLALRTGATTTTRISTRIIPFITRFFTILTTTRPPITRDTSIPIRTIPTRTGTDTTATTTTVLMAGHSPRTV